MGRPTALVVAGPGIVPGGVEAVRAFAHATGVGVLNTFGVKGLFRWDDPTHHGTIGLQARDVELAGVLDAGIVLAVGLDERELGADDLGPRVEVVSPDELDAWRGRVEPAPRGPFYDRLRAALLPLYDSESVPLNAAAAVADIPGVLPPGALVCADPGPVGLWVARALPTLELGSVLVPAVDEDDSALRHAVATAATGRPVLYLTDRELTDRELASEPPAGMVVEQWRADGEPRTREQRRDALTTALSGDGSRVFATAIDLDATSVLVDVAGPVTAWTRDVPSDTRSAR